MAFKVRLLHREQLHTQSELDRNGNLYQYKQSFSNKPYSQDASSASIRPDVSYDFVFKGHDPGVSELQLINEVKGIYAGLVMVEKKCVEIVAQQANLSKRLENRQWKALVALHRTVLQEHHDFFIVSQHPTASDTFKRLAVKYAIPARMWRHGIHAFLELLRRRLPDSMDHTLSFIYLAYSMMTLLKESVPNFMQTWIECLGDLARYRMGIKDFNLRDGSIWRNVARTRYSEAADRFPVGWIQHHLAVLARPRIVPQLFRYLKVLENAVPFVNARESILMQIDRFGTRSGEPQNPSSTNVTFKSESANKVIQNNRHSISARIARAMRHQMISNMTFLGLLLLNLPITLALPTQSRPRVNDYDMHDSILTIVSWIVFLVLGILIPFLRFHVQPDNQITTAVYPAYASGVAIICAGDTGIAGLVKGMIQGCWMGFTIWYYLATTALDDRNWTHMPRYLLPFVIIYQLLSTSRMGDAGMRPDLSTCVPYLSLCLTVTLNAVLFEYSGRIKRLAQRLWAACFHEHLPQ